MSRAIHKMRGLLAKIISITQTAFQSDTSANPWNYTGLSIGPAPTGGRRRFVFIIAHITDVSGVSNDTPDINSVAATLAVEKSTASEAHVWIGYREINTGTTVTVDFSAGGTADESGIGVYAVITGPEGLSVEATDTDGTDNYNMSVAGTKNGALLAGSSARVGSFHTWGGAGGIVEDYDNEVSTSNYSGASILLTSTGAKVVTCTISGNRMAGALCSLKYGA